MEVLNYKIPVVGCLKDSKDYYVMKLDSVTSVTKNFKPSSESWVIYYPDTTIELSGRAYIQYNYTGDVLVFYLLTTENKYKITGCVTTSTRDRINILLNKPIEIIY